MQMNLRTISDLLVDQDFFRGIKRDYIDFIAGCASNVHFRKGQFIALRGKPASHFYLIRSGHAALEVDAANRTVIIQTVSAGHVIGWSWLEPPYEWQYDVRTVEDVSAVAFDATCVREKCDGDPVFGYEMYKRFIRVVINRLDATRVQLTDMYA
jgi:CRP-like cAMP-binding protein